MSAAPAGAELTTAIGGHHSCSGMASRATQLKALRQAVADELQSEV